MSEHVIEISDLSRRFGKKQALDNVSLSVPEGAVFGLVGENGAGKTTLLKHVLGFLKPQQGTVRVFGLDPVADPPGVLGRIGHLSETRDLPTWMTIRELFEFTRAFYPKWDPVYAEELRMMFELSLNQKVPTLSRGQLARAGLLLALAHRPPLLVLDEPSSGLDPVVRKDILDAIIRTVVDEGRTVLFSSHLLDEVQRVSDRVAILDQGKILLTSPLDEVLVSHYQLTVSFQEPQPFFPELAGALTWSGSGREWKIICNGQKQELEVALQELKAEILEQNSPTLEEIFVARMKSAARSSFEE
ncbi:ABC transporter ATP-binding protein YtrB [Gimesia alba]|uniref:ABC transporter ATP-binding protein YtrB n=1 Tax=Gimesia alba TaxID=2527973 RepID=A0A517RNV9_9PLAN|nr:ABC transporter ATP-binding protein [Gimesia alba]QDT45567.1 ABC transporter ATP-binding protein YtrB [Gimesia alba]